MLATIVLLAVFGILVPWFRGVDFLDPVMTGAYACLGGLFAAPSAARAFAGPERPPAREAYLTLFRIVALSEGLVLLMLLLGVVTVNATRPGRIRLPVLDTLGTSAVFGLALTTALAAGAAWLTVRFSLQAALRSTRAIYLALALAFLYWSRWLPDIALVASVVATIIAAVMMALLGQQLGSR